ncbi:MAG: class I SAM-dependent methyltransferase [Desulfatirhabdiaceae bacterium]
MSFDDKIKEQYRGEKGKNYHDAINFVPDNVYPWVARLRRDKIIPFINNQDIVFEYGVGTGWNISELTCGKRIGYDLSAHLEPGLIKNNIEFTNDIHTISDESIDVVICHHVLEHTSCPPDILKDIRRILCKKGKLLLFVPYETGNKYHHYDPDEPNRHLYSWNVQTLGNLVDQLDFKIIKGSIERFGYDRFSSVWANKLHLGESGFRLLRRLIHVIKPAFEVFMIALKN